MSKQIQEAYIAASVPAKKYVERMNELEDMELNAIADARLKDGKQLLNVRLEEL